MADGSTFHFALTGGAAGTLVDQSLLDVSIDYGSSARGISIGAGGFLICDQTVTPVSMLRELMHFLCSRILREMHPLPRWHLAHQGNPRSNAGRRRPPR